MNTLVTCLRCSATVKSVDMTPFDICKECQAAINRVEDVVNKPTNKKKKLIPTEQFEYMQEWAPSGQMNSDEKGLIRLNELGKQGWKLVTASTPSKYQSGTHWTLMRKKNV